MKIELSFFLSLLFLLWGAAAGAQDCTELSSSSSSSSFLQDLLGEDASGITDACQLSVGEDYYTARIAYRGFDDDKEYRITARLLGANRRKIPGCEPLVLPLPGGSSSADLAFRFEPAASGAIQPYVDVRYLKVSIADADDPLAEFGADLNLSGSAAEYRLEHRFRVGGSGNNQLTISVGLTPVGRAATIKQ